MNSVIIRHLGQQAYQTTWKAMQDFTAARDANTPDEIWLLEHSPVFTQGQSGKPEHILNAGDIPIVNADRGGQVTYHGPGQLVAYILVDLKRQKLNVRELVSALEKSVIDTLNDLGINAYAKREAPGVYVDHAKICSIGLRIRRGCSYHGIALNVDMDLSPFERIHPCGFSGLKMVQIRELSTVQSMQEVENKLITYLVQNLGYTTAQMR